MIPSLILFLLVIAASIYGMKTDNAMCRGSKMLDLQHTTLLRGVAILMIVVGHVSGTFNTVILSPLPAAGVAIFMILSGYGLTLSYNKNGLKNFWPKKVLRVLLPYSFVIAALLLIQKNYDLERWILELTGLKTFYWYVGYQIKWYIVFFLVMMFAVRYDVLLFGVISAVMFFVLPSLAAEQSFAFVIGVAMARYRERMLSLSYRNILCLGLAVFLIGTAFLAVKQLPCVRIYLGTKLYSAIQLIINLSYAVSIIALSSLFPRLKNSVLLMFAGGVSYEIYLLHFPFYGKVGGDFYYACLLIVLSILASKFYQKFIVILTTPLQRMMSKL